LNCSNQKTIAHEVSCLGIGLHSGNMVNLTIKPADVDTGIIFRKISHDGQHIIDIEANYNSVSNTLLNTTLTKGSEHISTVEHMMAALWGCEIDNIIIELSNGDELPIMDGSSEQFVFMIECAGIKKQNKGKRIIEVLKTVDVREGSAFASISPSEGFSVSMEIDFENQVISNQKCSFDSINSSFKMDLCRARTFGFEDEVKKMQEMGLGKGGSLENAIVVGEDKILNKEGLRYKDEFVRHKILDSIGDLYLAGAQMKGHFRGFKSGHKLNNKLLKEFFSDLSAWRIIELPFEIEQAIPQI